MTKKEISLKNYIYLFLIIGITIGIVYYLYLWFTEYEEKVRNVSVLSNYLQVINYNEVDNYIIENDEVYLYVTDANFDLNDFEYELKKFIVNNNLEKDILYLDISNNYNDGKYSIMNNEFKSIPMFIVFNNSQIISSYDIKNNGYDTNKIESYFRSLGVIR